MKGKSRIIVILSLAVLGFLSNKASGEEIALKKLESSQCPIGKEEFCQKLLKIEELYAMLPDQPEYEPVNIVIPAQALSIGYAHFGNLEKSKNYYQATLGIEKPPGNIHTLKDWDSVRLGRVLEQYILKGEIRETIEALKENRSNKYACSSIVQMLAYQQNIHSLQRVFRDTNCTTYGINSVCRVLNEQDVNLLFSEMKKVLEKYPFNTEFKNQHYLEAEKCLKNIMFLRAGEGHIPALEELTQIVPLENTINHDHLKARLISLNLQKGSATYAQALFTTIEDSKIKEKAARELIGWLASQNDPAAFEYQRLYPELDGGVGETEIQFVLLLNKKTTYLTERLAQATNTLENAKKHMEIGGRRDLKILSKECPQMTFLDCMFYKIVKIYEVLPADQKEKNKRTFIYAHAIMGKYEYLSALDLSEVWSKDESDNWRIETLKKVARYNADCELFLEKTIVQTLGPGGLFPNNLYSNAIADCLISSGKYKTMFSSDPTQPLTPIQSALTRMLKDRFIERHHFASDDLPLIETNLPKDLRNKVIYANLNAITNIEKPFYPELKSEQRKEILSKTANYLARQENFDPYVVRSFIKVYENMDKEDLPSLSIDLKTIKAKSEAIMKAERERQENDRIIKPENFSTRLQKQADELQTEIRKIQPFIPVQQPPVTVCIF